MSEDRSVLYKIRWEILVMAAALVLSAVVVLAIPNDFSEKLIQQEKEKRELEKVTETEEEVGFDESEGGADLTTP